MNLFDFMDKHPYLTGFIAVLAFLGLYDVGMAFARRK